MNFTQIKKTNINQNGTFNNTGTFTNVSGDSLNNFGTILNDGIIDNLGEGVINNFGLIINNGEIIGDGFLNMCDGGEIIGDGTIDPEQQLTGDCSFIPPEPDVNVVGGELIRLDTTMVLVAGTQNTAAWMIPVIVSAIGIGIVIARKF